jgi:hypothetical protein
MIYDELPTAWRFVKDPTMLASERPCSECNKESAYEVITDTSYLLPFVYRGAVGEFYLPQTFILEDENGFQIDLSAYIPGLAIMSTATNFFIVSVGISFPTSSPLQEGTWQAQLWDGSNTLYSEPIRICGEFEKCIRFSWKNSCDLAGIPYTRVDSFFNVLFLEQTPILSSEYETEKEESENMLRQIDPIFASQKRTMRLKTSGPDWVVRMFQAMQLHDTVTISYMVNAAHPEGLYSSEVESLTVTASTLQDNECVSEIEIKFVQDDSIISTACCVPQSYIECLDPCYAVEGFKDDFGAYQDGDYYLESVDSPLILQYDGDGFVEVTSDCVYVLSLDTNAYLFYNGDLWQPTPTISSVVFDGIDIVTGNGMYTITGFTMPNTFVYLSYSNPAVFDYTTPITASQLAAGYQFIVPPGSGTVEVSIISMGYGCSYGTSPVFVP